MVGGWRSRAYGWRPTFGFLTSGAVANAMGAFHRYRVRNPPIRPDMLLATVAQRPNGTNNEGPIEEQAKQRAWLPLSRQPR